MVAILHRVPGHCNALQTLSASAIMDGAIPNGLMPYR
jgi:hypothetical protein